MCLKDNGQLRVIEDRAIFTRRDKLISNAEIRKLITPDFNIPNFVESIAKEINGEFIINLDCSIVNQFNERNENDEVENRLRYVWPSINTPFYSKRIKSPRSFQDMKNELREFHMLSDTLMKVFTVHDAISFYTNSHLRPRDIITLVIYINKTGQSRL